MRAPRALCVLLFGGVAGFLKVPGDALVWQREGSVLHPRPAAASAVHGLGAGAMLLRGGDAAEDDDSSMDRRLEAAIARQAQCDRRDDKGADGSSQPTEVQERVEDEIEDASDGGKDDKELVRRMQELMLTRKQKFESMVREEQITRYQKAAEFLNSCQHKYRRYQDALEKLVAQQTESRMVLDELQAVSAGRKVFKLIGPCMLPQDPTESKETVELRLEFIAGQLKLVKGKIAALEKAAESRQRDAYILQNLLQAQMPVDDGSAVS